MARTLLHDAGANLADSYRRGHQIERLPDAKFPRQFHPKAGVSTGNLETFRANVLQWSTRVMNKTLPALNGLLSRAEGLYRFFMVLDVRGCPTSAIANANSVRRSPERSIPLG